MKKKSLVFSLVREQSVFMTVVISVLTFMAVLAFGIALSIGTGVKQWNGQWDKYATVQVVNSDHLTAVKKIINENSNKIESTREISKSEMEQLMRPWISNGAKLSGYLPQMIEIKTKNTSYINELKKQIEPHAKFLTHSSALKTSMSAGWKLVFITIFILIIILASIMFCVSCISRNIAMLHKHELEILNQVGASDKFIAHQMQIIVGKISSVACLIGFATAIPVMTLILLTARSARVGLLATLSLSLPDIIAIILLPIIIVIFSVYITKETTLKILSGK